MVKGRILKNARLVAILTVALISSGIPTASQATVGNSWIPISAQDNDPTFHSVAFKDYLPLEFNYSVLQKNQPNGRQVCKSTADPSCQTGESFAYNSILKICQTPSELDCIESVNSIDSSGISTTAKFSRYTVTDHLNAYPANTQLGIPAGGMPSIWKIPSATHKSGDDYALIAGLTGDAMSNGQANTLSGYLQVSLVPVVLKDFGKGKNSQSGGWNNKFVEGVFYDFCATAERTSGIFSADCGHVNDDECLLPTNDQGICYAAEEFNGNPKFNVQIRLSKEPNGWLHGRMTDPNVSIVSNTSGGVKLSVGANSVKVPLVYHGGLWNSLPATVKQFYVDCFTNRQCGWPFLRSGNSSWVESANSLDGQAKLNLNVFPYAFGTRALAGMAAIATLVGDKSNSESSSWSFRTLTSDEMNGSNKCFTSSPGIKGIVTTNSTTYSAGPPQLSDGFLQYKVASAHFLPDGITPFKGNYNLVMRSDTARCIYGFSSAPISASISVVSAEGNASVATTVTSEKDGWIALSANNFEFSSPIIKVKFAQAAVKSESKSSATKRITCVKGKVKKIVTSISGQCPKGYTRS